MFCSQCGNENLDSAKFCANCGNNLSQHVPPALASEPTDSTDGLLAGFVGDNYYGYYRDKWFKKDVPNLDSKKGVSIFGFNLAGFFLGVFWMCYRKMYGLAFMLAIAITTLDIIVMRSKGFEDYDGFDSLSFGLMAFMFTGIMGNYFYYQHSARRIHKISISISDPAIVRQQLAAQGGTTWFGGIGVGLLIIIMTTIMYAMFAPSWY